ncbi:MAG TPA: hypothetical protein VFJ76_06825 [Solirubrobacterales bacterium]|nr:hypothetical protein [Solirubrobacterales bacterium]
MEDKVLHLLESPIVGGDHTSNVSLDLKPKEVNSMRITLSAPAGSVIYTKGT